MFDVEPATLPSGFYLRMEEQFRKMRAPIEQGREEEKPGQGEAQD